MKKIAVGLLFLAGSGCTLAPKTFVMPDGQTGYLVECNGSALTIASCYNQAAKFCGGKYEVVGQDGHGNGRGQWDDCALDEAQPSVHLR